MMTSTDSDLIRDNYRELCALIAAEQNEQFISDIFTCLFTDAERKDFSERWLIVKALAAGMPQRTIAKEFKLSLCKITRGSRELKKEDNAFSRMLRKLADLHTPPQ